MKATLNRRRFVAVLATAGAGGLIVPAYLRSSDGTSGTSPMLPFVTQTAFYGIIIDPNTGAFTIPAGCPVGYHAVNETAIGSINTIVPAQPAGTPPPLYMQAFDYYAKNNPPAGFSVATPQVAILEILVGVAVLAAGAYVVYKIYKWASQIPPPDTNVYR